MAGDASRQNGRKGGRPKGARNHATVLHATGLAPAAALRASGSSVFERLGGPQGQAYAEMLHRLAIEPHNDPHVRVKALGLIAPYIWKRLPESHEDVTQVAVHTTIVHEHVVEAPERER